MSDRLTDILANWQALKVSQRPTLIKTFTQGLNHQTHLVQIGETQCVLKLFKRPNRLAIEAQQLAAKSGLAPSIRYANKAADVVLMDYINASSLSPCALGDTQITALAKALSKLHHLSVDGVNALDRFELRQVCEHYLNQLNSIQKDLYQIHSQLTPVFDIFLADGTTWCLCHNDLVAQNCLIDEDQLVIIDWEYAQVHNPWFDLAAAIYYLKLNKVQSQQFLEHYNPGWGNKHNHDICLATQCAVLWVDILWHLVRTKGIKNGSISDKLTDLQRLTNALDVYF